MNEPLTASANPLSLQDPCFHSIWLTPGAMDCWKKESDHEKKNGDQKENLAASVLGVQAVITRAQLLKHSFSAFESAGAAFLPPAQHASCASVTKCPSVVMQPPFCCLVQHRQSIAIIPTRSPGYASSRNLHVQVPTCTLLPQRGAAPTSGSKDGH